MRALNWIKDHRLITCGVIAVLVSSVLFATLRQPPKVSSPPTTNHNTKHSHVVRPRITNTTNAVVATTTTIAASQVANATPIPVATGSTVTAPITSTTVPAPSSTPITVGGTTYAAYIDPRFTQSPTNPLVVTYIYSAGASTLVGGVNLALSSLPSGTLTLSADGTQECTMSVGAEVTGGTCGVTFVAFGTHMLTATYVTGGNTTNVVTTDDVEPYSTTTVAAIYGGGSLGGLEFDAAVTDSNGNAVDVGTVTMTVGDQTQGWAYTVMGSVGQDGARPSDFACLFVENYPSVGEYSGCNIFGPIHVTPASGDKLTINATYEGTSDWQGSLSTPITYSMP